MRLKPIKIALLLLLITVAPSSAGVNIIEKVTSKANNEAHSRLFVQLEKRQILLPARSAYVSRVSSADKSIWAINFHEVSSYNDVDLVVWRKRRLLVIPHLWNKVEAQVKAKNIIPDWPFDHLIFAVEKIRGTKLRCLFYGASHQKQAEFSKKFSISLIPQKSGFKFQVS